MESDDTQLTEKDIKKIKKILKSKKFEDFEIHSYYFRDKFTGTLSRTPRHDIELKELKKIYEKQNLIKRGFKRKGKRGYKYTLCYDESKNVFVKVCYLFDENPMKIFNAFRIFRNLENTVLKKYGLKI